MYANPPIVRHFGNNPQLEVKQKAPVLIKDPETGKIRGPYPLVTWRKWYACVSTENGPRWILAKNTRPFRESLEFPQKEDHRNPGISPEILTQPSSAPVSNPAGPLSGSASP